jgi:hypothetical protein
LTNRPRTEDEWKTRNARWKTKNTEQKHNTKPRPRFEGRSQHRLQFFIARTEKAGKNKGKKGTAGTEAKESRREIYKQRRATALPPSTPSPENR